ncbi:MAG TPA: arginyltransferase [Gemmataceae bacterium]|jgi:arginine-tRNA-protein transferase|nr:arginyltransferase [Gemmataceae bacterium]
MISLHQFTTSPSECSYLPDRKASMRYEIVLQASAEDYEERLLSGWRKFGRAVFRPVCKRCRACQSVRVPTATFHPDRSQRRARKANPDVEVVVAEPSVTEEKLALYDSFHEYQSAAVGWTEHGPKNPAEYHQSFVDNPFPTEEWQYRLAGRLIGVGYVDVVSAGLSAIYFYYDPAERDRSLGTYNVLRVIESAAARGLPHVYLGYYVAGCRSLEYKARFQPNEVLGPDGEWAPFRAQSASRER